MPRLGSHAASSTSWKPASPTRNCASMTSESDELDERRDDRDLLHGARVAAEDVQRQQPDGGHGQEQREDVVDRHRVKIPAAYPP